MTTPTTIDDLHSDILTHALRHMDGPSLAAASCATSHLRSLSSNPSIWRDLCLSTWPSLRHPRLASLLSDHRTFFSQSYPYPSPTNHNDEKAPLPVQLISAIDLYHRGFPVFSRVIETDTSSSWFLTSPFRVDGLDRKDPNPYPSTEPAINPEELTLSWIVIDPNSDSKQAANVSSRQPVSVDRHWYTGELLVRFVVVLRGCAVSVVVTCGDETGHVRELGMTVEDMDGISVSGRESLRILKAAMEGGRVGVKEEEEVRVREQYREYVKKKRERRERKMRREGKLDFCCTAFGAMVFLLFLMLLAFRW